MTGVSDATRKTRELLLSAALVFVIVLVAGMLPPRESPEREAGRGERAALLLMEDVSVTLETALVLPGWEHHDAAQARVSMTVENASGQSLGRWLDLEPAEGTETVVEHIVPLHWTVTAA